MGVGSRNRFLRSMEDWKTSVNQERETRWERRREVKSRYARICSRIAGCAILHAEPPGANLGLYRSKRSLNEPQVSVGSAESGNGILSGGNCTRIVSFQKRHTLLQIVMEG